MSKATVHRLKVCERNSQTFGNVYSLEGGEIMTYATGEKPGKGTYVCTNCDQQVVLDDVTDTLPPCPKCNNTTYTK